MKFKFLPIYYFILLAIEISAELLFLNFNNPSLMFATKPILMPTLIIWAFLFAKQNLIPLNNTLIAALVFPMLGDISLMFVSFYSQIFILGLAFFLIAHILYIALFLNSPFKSKTSYLKNKPSILLICLCYCSTLIWYLYRQNQSEFMSMQLPIILYAFVILIMLLSALSIYKKQSKGMTLIVIGAALFVISDSTIALSKFSLLFNDNQSFARIIIMSLYGIAQFMIVKGYLMSTISYQLIQIKKPEEPS